MTHGSLFSGVGGFDLAAQRFAAWRMCRIDKLNFNREPVLRHYAKPLLGAVSHKT